METVVSMMELVEMRESAMSGISIIFLAASVLMLNALHIAKNESTLLIREEASEKAGICVWKVLNGQYYKACPDTAHLEHLRV